MIVSNTAKKASLNPPVIVVTSCVAADAPLLPPPTAFVWYGLYPSIRLVIIVFVLHWLWLWTWRLTIAQHERIFCWIIHPHKTWLLIPRGYSIFCHRFLNITTLCCASTPTEHPLQPSTFNPQKPEHKHQNEANHSGGSSAVVTTTTVEDYFLCWPVASGERPIIFSSITRYPPL